jgi:hypothetical protein
LRNWKFLRFCKQGNKQGSLASGHKPGDLVSVLALGPSAYPKNDRDLTVRTMYPQYNNSIKKEKKGKQYLFAKLIKKSCW